MSFLAMFKHPDINQGLQEFASVPGAILLDVRTPDEHRQAHIPGSRNLPLGSLNRIGSVAQQKDIPLFVYCQSGVRSRRAAADLAQMGYSNVKNIGGFFAYNGKVE